MPYIIEIVVTLASYFLGCFSTGYYLVRFRTGQDIRSLGSGSTGARNVGRLLGIRGFIITALGDCAKGAIPVGVAVYLQLEQWSVVLAMVAVVVGHIWPIQLRFRGGRGVVTAVGALLVFDYQLVLLVLLLAGIVYIITRRFTISGLVAIILSPAIAVVMGRSPTVVLAVVALMLIILIAHRSVIRDFFVVVRGKMREDETKPHV